ncbi:MAG: DsbA family protein [Elusimicrobia bacterium]|nr:DsbA family protein [Elusimicrobiota bacterium]
MTWKTLAMLAVAAPAYAFDKDAMAEHMRETYNIPAIIDIAFSTPAAAGVPGFKQAQVTFTHGQNVSQENLWVSDDGRHYLMGAFKDLKVQPDNDRLAKMDLANSASRGPKDAPVVIVQYTDFQCPFCQRGFELMREQVMKEYAGKVRWIYKALPLTSIHPWAEPAAVAVECAKLQGQDKFWAMHDRLFESQREISLANVDEKASLFMKEAKGDVKKFETCFESKKTLPNVNKDALEAEAMGINGTPAFIVNGHQAAGGANYPEIKRLIEESLKGRHGKV